jgi:hypothetical protein
VKRGELSGWTLAACLCLTPAPGCSRGSGFDSDAAGDELSSAVAALRGAPGGGDLWLSELGLYADVVSKRIARGVVPLEPRYALWSDGADKRRWLRLPAGTQIDASDMDDWQFPIGTLAFKEFASDGRRVETRVIARTGGGPRDYWMGAFVWSDDDTDARFAPEGELDARGTEHDVPAAATCGVCHDGEPGRLLGFAAVQEPGVPEALVSVTPPRALLPLASDSARRALGYLHANCAHCHNPRGSARPDTDLDLRLSVGDRAANDTAAVRTAVAQPLQRSGLLRERFRIAPGAPERSGLWQRMSQRGSASQMPPLATERVDLEGRDLVRAWIESLPQSRQ